MKTPEPPRSSKEKGKAEESAPKDSTPMARFRQAAASVFSAPKAEIDKAEKRRREKD